MNIRDFKSKLDKREIVEMHNSEDLVQIVKSKLSDVYLFIFNAKPLFGYKTFSSFAKKANEKIEQYSLVEVTGYYDEN